MEKIKSYLEETVKLRRRAEVQLQVARTKHLPQQGAEAQRLLHELEVHQIELEMQNAELHQAREEMEEVLGKYTDIYDFAPVGYFTLDRNGIIRAVNLAGAALLGLDRSRLLGRNFESFIVSGARSTFVALLRTVVANKVKESLDLELRLAQMQGGNPPLFVLIEVVASSTGHEYRVVAIDITKRRQAEEKLQSTIRDLQTFSHSISHDLRSPLRNIYSFATMFLEDYGGGLQEEGKQLINTIVKRTVSMGNLIDDLLRFSRNSIQDLSVKPIDMTALAKQIVERLSDEELNRAVEFRVAELPLALGDRSMVAQVLENLLSNAVKFSRKVEKPVISVGSVADKADNTYFVKDNGVGFDLKYLGTIFNAFQRLHSAEDFAGTGVGLAIVEQIVTKHGGRVWADSKQGKGATFYFSLPRQ